MRTRRKTLIGGLALLAVILMGSGLGSNCGAIAADSAPQGVVDAGSSAKTMSLDLGGGVKLELVLIPAGTFSMGSDDGAEDERPVHKVAISQPQRGSRGKQRSRVSGCVRSLGRQCEALAA